jgi:hypothetical protein
MTDKEAERIREACVEVCKKYARVSYSRAVGRSKKDPLAREHVAASHGAEMCALKIAELDLSKIA